MLPILFWGFFFVFIDIFAINFLFWFILYEIVYIF